jgi:hypothetical protein
MCLNSTEREREGGIIIHLNQRRQQNHKMKFFNGGPSQAELDFLNISGWK